MPSNEYPYGFEFQLTLLALAFREPKFSIDYAFLLEPQYFDTEEFRHLARVVKDYHSRFGKGPEAIIARDLVRAYAISKKMDDSACLRIEQVLDRSLSKDLEDVEWVKEEATRFAKGQLMKVAILNAYHRLNDIEDYSVVVREFEKILEVDSPTNKIVNFRDIASEIPQQIRDNTTFGPANRIPTGLPTLDDHMFGGATRGKLGVVLAPSGTGKSHALTFFGSQAVRRGYAVFHFAFGDMNQWEVFLRYAANFTGIDSRDILRGTSRDYHTAILTWLQENNQDLFVSCHPPDTVTPSILKSMISSLISRTGVHPGLVIVDYADNLATGMKHTVNAAEQNALMSMVYQQLLKIAAQFNCALWTGSQVARNYYRTAATLDNNRQLMVIDTEAIAQAIKKIDHADYVLSLNQSREESNQNMARLYEAKIRFGSDKHIIGVHFNKATSTFVETGLVEDAETQADPRPRRTRPAEPVIPESQTLSPEREALQATIGSVIRPYFADGRRS